jgi:hypothetical protein
MGDGGWLTAGSDLKERQDSCEAQDKFSAPEAAADKTR